MNNDFGELRRRLKELLAVPEAQRTDPQWDEIIELEVQLAPGNRIGAPTPGVQQQQQRNKPQGGRNFAPGKPGFSARKKGKKPPSQGGQGGQQGQGGGQAQGGGQGQGGQGQGGA